MTYEEWEEGVPEAITADTLWRSKAYRLSLFLADLGWVDTEKLIIARPTAFHADQLRRATSKISSSISEGYTRDTAKARATYYEYATGSARESRDWYYKLRRAFSSKVIEHRINLCTDIVRLTLRMIGNERKINRRVSKT